MKRLLTNYNDRQRVMASCKVYENVFSQEDIDKFKDYCGSLELDTALVGEARMEITSKRKGQKSFFKSTTANHWIFQKIFNVVTDANSRHWGFDLWGCNQIQYTVYDTQGDHYDWHTDLFFDSAHNDHRKLSVVIPLTAPEEYQGGEFQIMLGSSKTISQPLGSAILFPSFLLHRITPVTAGRRASLVLWFTGPKFL
jgi:predicted 2-oxoglutarate/Fe(II)-dependent dioxygenase YbiX